MKMKSIIVMIAEGENIFMSNSLIIIFSLLYVYTIYIVITYISKNSFEKIIEDIEVNEFVGVALLFIPFLNTVFIMSYLIVRLIKEENKK